MFTKKLNTKSAFSAPIIILLLIAWAFLCFRIGAAWLGHQDANRAWISTALRNYERYGFFTLNGLITFNTTPTLPFNIPDYYIRHPPLAVWISYPFIAIAGFHEALVRIIFSGCTLISAAALATLAKRLFKSGAGWTLSFYLFTPMMLYFGRMPDHEAPALMFGIILSVILVDWIRHPTRSRLITAALLIALLAWTAWGGLMLAVSLCGVLLLVYKKRWRGLLALIFTGIISALAVILYYQAVWPGAIQELVNFFIWRTSSASGTPDTSAFSIAEYLIRISIRLLTLFTPTILVLAIFGIWQMRRQFPLSNAVIAGFLLGALSFTVVFRNASFIHDYYLIYFAPAIALLAAMPLAFQRASQGRFIRPVITALILIWPIVTLAVLTILYTGSTNNEPLRLASAVNNLTQPEDIILSNHPNDGLAIEFYAEREIRWNTPPEAIPNLVQGSHRLFYLYCGDRDALDTVQTSEITNVLNSCWLARINE